MFIVITFTDDCTNKAEGFIKWKSASDDSKFCMNCNCQGLYAKAKKAITTRLCCDNFQSMQTECCPLCTGLMAQGKHKFCKGIVVLNILFYSIL